MEAGRLDKADASRWTLLRAGPAVQSRPPVHRGQGTAKGELQQAVFLLERCVRVYESVDARFAILAMASMLGPAYTLSYSSARYTRVRMAAPAPAARA